MLSYQNCPTRYHKCVCISRNTKFVTYLDAGKLYYCITYYVSAITVYTECECNVNVNMDSSNNSNMDSDDNNDDVILDANKTDEVHQDDNDNNA